MSMLKVRLQRDWWSPEKHLYRKGDNEIGSHLKGLLPKSAKILGDAEPAPEQEQVLTPTSDNPAIELDTARAASDQEEKVRLEAEETARKQELAKALQRTSRN